MKKSIRQFYFFSLLFTILPAQSILDKYGDRIELLGIPFKGPMELCQIFIAIFLFIAFFQSGLDKVIDRKGNLDFLKAHFSDSPIIKIIPIMLLILTLLEIIGSVMLGYGVYYALVNRSTLWIFYGFVVIAITIIILFAGQRIAKDYLGAADLVPYFILIMLGIMSMY
tara:strand:+ start:515 stop:1018 length:504 start_codon:yes stop_codon:yes gene_type:complete